MAITAAQVKQLREVTGAGMMDCKKALTQTNGDMDAAIEFLRKKGQAKAEKKASRIAAEGICLIAQDDDSKAAVVEVNSETDFVAQNEKFRTYVAKVAHAASDTKDIAPPATINPIAINIVINTAFFILSFLLQTFS